ncbi:hypothetical protein ASF43_13690 [Pseudorhodoferax sp. Leaf267]|nr:hypothetical protein ASF43_13690 [Pseudorhodoferax sp. Leaf267]
MAEGQPQAAFAILEPLEPERARDPAYSFLLGISALDAGHNARAIFALERAVLLNPEDNLARAELARAYLAAGETAEARTELRRARQGQMPAEAAAAIDRVLGAIDQEPVDTTASIWRGYVEGFAGHDSNANSATAAGQFALPAFGGIVFEMSPENQRRSAAFGGAGAGLGVRLPLNAAWELEAAVNARTTFYRHADAFDSRYLDASAGVAYTRGASRFTTALQGNLQDIDRQRYRRNAGLSAQWQYTLDRLSQVSVFAQHGRLDYAIDPTRDADRTVYGLGYARALNEGRQVAYGSVYRAQEKPRASGVENYGHRAVGARAGAEATLTDRWQAFAAVQYERRRYGGSEPFFDMGRVDRQFDFTTGLHFKPAPAWRISPQLAFVRAQSNVVLFEYRRVIWQLAVRREFP